MNRPKTVVVGERPGHDHSPSMGAFFASLHFLPQLAAAETHVDMKTKRFNVSMLATSLTKVG